MDGSPRSTLILFLTMAAIGIPAWYLFVSHHSWPSAIVAGLVVAAGGSLSGYFFKRLLDSHKPPGLS